MVSGRINGSLPRSRRWFSKEKLFRTCRQTSKKLQLLSISFEVIGFNIVDILLVLSWFNIDFPTGHGAYLCRTITSPIILHAQGRFTSGFENSIGILVRISKRFVTLLYSLDCKSIFAISSNSLHYKTGETAQLPRPILHRNLGSEPRVPFPPMIIGSGKLTLVIQNHLGRVYKVPLKIIHLYRITIDIAHI